MKQVLRLTESELKKIVENSVRRAIKDRNVNEGYGKDIAKTVGAGLLGGAALTADMAMDGPISRGVEKQISNRAKKNQADPATRKEFGKALKGKNPADSIPTQKDIKDPKTRSWTGENVVKRAVMESIKNLMNEISTDTIDSASDKAAEKARSAASKYGSFDPRTKRAKEQASKFANKWNDEYVHGNDARKARLEKNREDR